MKPDHTMEKKTLLTLAIVVFLACLMALAACQPAGTSDEAQDAGTEEQSQQSSASSDEGPVAADFTFAMDADCGMCHETEKESEADTALLCSTHATQENLQCTSCHSDEAGLTSAHDGVILGDKVPKRAKATTVEDSYCLTCHDDYPVLAEQTAASTVLTDANGTTVNPHEVPTLTEGHAGQLSCATCHSMHKAADYKATCISCHHADVYECRTCHEA